MERNLISKSNPIYTDSDILQTMQTVNTVPNEEDEIPTIAIDRTNEILHQIVEINAKGQKCLKFSHDSFRVKKLDESFKFNCTKFDMSLKEIAKENKNLPSEKLFLFNNGDNIGKKHEKVLLEKVDNFPTCVIGRIHSSFENNYKVLIGTGTLIGPNIVITSASNVFRKKYGK